VRNGGLTVVASAGNDVRPGGQRPAAGGAQGHARGGLARGVQGPAALQARGSWRLL